jgi:3'-phosphoadenosine 5'-phosphosulfate sulfotransferase (PAPS reductase)/FAD synthetase
MHENRELPAVPVMLAGRSGKADSRNPDMDTAGKSDIGVVLMTSPNKAGLKSGGGGEEREGRWPRGILNSRLRTGHRAGVKH